MLPKAERERLQALDAAERERFAAEFLGRDPLPETPVNELAEAVERRRRLVQIELLGFGDDRSRLLFLRGRPAARETIECGQVYRPMEIWTYGAGETTRRLVLYRPGPGRPFQLWLPTDGKRVLYIPEMEYLLDQWEELRARLSGAIAHPQVDALAGEPRPQLLPLVEQVLHLGDVEDALAVGRQPELERAARARAVEDQPPGRLAGAVGPDLHRPVDLAALDGLARRRPAAEEEQA